MSYEIVAIILIVLVAILAVGALRRTMTLKRRIIELEKKYNDLNSDLLLLEQQCRKNNQ